MPENSSQGSLHTTPSIPAVKANFTIKEEYRNEINPLLHSHAVHQSGDTTAMTDEFRTIPLSGKPEKENERRKKKTVCNGWKSASGNKRRGLSIPRKRHLPPQISSNDTAKSSQLADHYKQHRFPHRALSTDLNTYQTSRQAVQDEKQWSEFVMESNPQPISNCSIVESTTPCEACRHRNSQCQKPKIDCQTARDNATGFLRPACIQCHYLSQPCTLGRKQELSPQIQTFSSISEKGEGFIKTEFDDTFGGATASFGEIGR